MEDKYTLARINNYCDTVQNPLSEIPKFERFLSVDMMRHKWINKHKTQWRLEPPSVKPRQMSFIFVLAPLCCQQQLFADYCVFCGVKILLKNVEKTYG